MQEPVDLECAICRRRTYSLRRNKKVHSDRLELKKYCRFCRSHTLHKETK